MKMAGKRRPRRAPSPTNAPACRTCSFRIAARPARLTCPRNRRSPRHGPRTSSLAIREPVARRNRRSASPSPRSPRAPPCWRRSSDSSALPAGRSPESAFDNRRGHAEQRQLARKYQRAFGHRPRVAGEAKFRQVAEKILAPHVAEKKTRCRLEMAISSEVEADVFQEFQHAAASNAKIFTPPGQGAGRKART